MSHGQGRRSAATRIGRLACSDGDSLMSTGLWMASHRRRQAPPVQEPLATSSGRRLLKDARDRLASPIRAHAVSCLGRRTRTVVTRQGSWEPRKPLVSRMAVNALARFGPLRGLEWRSLGAAAQPARQRSSSGNRHVLPVSAPALGSWVG